MYSDSAIIQLFGHCYISQIKQVKWAFLDIFFAPNTSKFSIFLYQLVSLSMWNKDVSRTKNTTPSYTGVKHLPPNQSIVPLPGRNYGISLNYWRKFVYLYQIDKPAINMSCEKPKWLCSCLGILVQAFALSCTFCGRL